MMNLLKDTEIQGMGADPKDYNRSRVAKRIFHLARENNLQFAHYEYRWPIPLPDSWNSEKDHHAQGEVHWHQGVLSELKYQSFRHDSAVCNFHPGQSSKWGAHELCHKLVGFVFKPQADILFHTLAAWAAEVLPVTVYYFWDEIDCFRCERHKVFGFMQATFCKACEITSKEQDVKREDYKKLGWDFLNTQLAAIEASIREQKIVSAPYMALDLADDAYYYTLSQFPRLTSKVYEDFIQTSVPSQIYKTSIDDLITRIRMVAEAIMEDKELPSYGLNNTDWKVLDLGFRGLELAENIEGDAKQKFINTTQEFFKNKNIENYVKKYTLLCKEYDLPPAKEFFAAGYVVADGLGYLEEQVLEGIKTLVPDSFEEISDSTLNTFFKADRANRNFLCERLAEHISEEHIQIEIFLNQPQSFFAKDYSCRQSDKIYKWSDRVRVCKNSDKLQVLLGLDSEYFILYKDTSGEVLSYPIQQILTSCEKDSFKLDELDLPLEEKLFYVQNDILVEASEA